MTIPNPEQFPSVETAAWESRLARTFVRLADTLVNGFDVVDLYADLVTSSVDLLELAACGLLLADQRGSLRVVAASSEQTRLLEVLELQNQQGPCWDCYRTAAPIAVADPTEQATRWPVFAAAADAQGFGPVYALPMRLRENILGTLNLFRPPGAVLTNTELTLAQALADVASIATINHRAHHAEQELAEQLQTALNSRIVIEQATGVLAQYADTDMHTSFTLLRQYARAHHARLTDIASAVATRRLHPGQLVS